MFCFPLMHLLIRSQQDWINIIYLTAKCLKSNEPDVMFILNDDIVCCRYSGSAITPFQHCVPGTLITVAFYSDYSNSFDTGFQAVYYMKGK